MAFHSWWFVIEAFMYRHKRERRREARRGHLLFSFPREFSLPVLYSLNFLSQKQQGNSTRKSSFTPPKVKRTKTVPWIPARAHLLKVTLSYYLIWKPRLIIPATSLGGLNKRAFYTVKKKKSENARQFLRTSASGHTQRKQPKHTRSFNQTSTNRATWVLVV